MKEVFETIQKFTYLRVVEVLYSHPMTSFLIRRSRKMIKGKYKQLCLSLQFGCVRTMNMQIHYTQYGKKYD